MEYTQSIENRPILMSDFMPLVKTVADLTYKVDNLTESVKVLSDDLRSFIVHTSSAFTHVEQRFQRLEGRMDTLELKMDAMELKFDNRFDVLEHVVRGQAQRLEVVEDRTQQLARVNKYTFAKT